jgi:hypothetical protein
MNMGPSVEGKDIMVKSGRVQALVVDCAFANLLAMDHEQYSIKNALILCIVHLKQPSSIPSCATKYPYILLKYPSQKWGI